MTPKGKALKRSYELEAKSQWGRRALITEELEIWITIYFGTKRKADWDNYHKLSCDALSGVVWEDDSLIHAAHVEKRFDKKRPRIEIEVV